MPSDADQATTDEATAAEAMRFGGLVLPDSARVLGVRHTGGLDRLYTLAVGLPPADVGELLERSGVTEPLTPDPGPFMTPIDGFDLGQAQSVETTEDVLPPSGDRKSQVFRRIAVDRSDPVWVVVHIWLFTT
ncbi:hypothetical protein [Amycolatopsis arida]|nr:hypothetical protein [Amycolatopsis arida]